MKVIEPISIAQALEISRNGVVFETALNALHDLAEKVESGNATDLEKRVLATYTLNMVIHVTEARRRTVRAKGRSKLDRDLHEWVETMIGQYSKDGLTGMTFMKVDPPPGA